MLDGYRYVNVGFNMDNIQLKEWDVCQGRQEYLRRFLQARSQSSVAVFTLVASGKLNKTSVVISHRL